MRRLTVSDSLWVQMWLTNTTIPWYLISQYLHCSQAAQSSRQFAVTPAWCRANPLSRSRWRVFAQSDPPDIPKEEGKQRSRAEWFQNIVSRFGPITSRPQNTAVLDFEKPLVELDNRIKEVSSLPIPLCALVVPFSQSFCNIRRRKICPLYTCVRHLLTTGCGLDLRGMLSATYKFWTHTADRCSVKI